MWLNPPPDPCEWPSISLGRVFDAVSLTYLPVTGFAVRLVPPTERTRGSEAGRLTSLTGVDEPNVPRSLIAPPSRQPHRSVEEVGPVEERQLGGRCNGLGETSFTSDLRCWIYVGVDLKRRGRGQPCICLPHLFINSAEKICWTSTKPVRPCLATSDVQRQYRPLTYDRRAAQM
jgi:hypothetical protein